MTYQVSKLQPVVDVRGHVQPVAIRYRTPAGEHTDAPGYVGETTFPMSFWRVVSEPRMFVELHLPPALAAGGVHRRALARAAEDTIRAIVRGGAIEPASAGSAGAMAPGTRDRHRA
jgi:1-acyl-sn-glycerol-3-phosphate acyltransferase